MFSQYEDFINKLISAGIEESEAKREISILLSEIGENNLEEIEKIVRKRVQTRIPIQYLLGKASFMDFEVKVNEKVLIPRPETEILVEETVKRLERHVIPAKAGIQKQDYMLRSSGFRVKPGMTLTALDIGTGSGIIAIAIAKLIPDIKITSIDIDKEIIHLAKENAKLNNVENKINFKICDVFSKCFEGLLQSQKFDLIVSNPPYVKGRTCYGKSVQPEIMHEPKIALSGSKENTTGLIYYERIIELIKKCYGLPRHCEEAQSADPLRRSEASVVISKRYEIALPLARNDVKLLAFEIDPPLVDDLKSLLKKNNLNNYEIIKDYSKLDRCLFVYP